MISPSVRPNIPPAPHITKVLSEESARSPRTISTPLWIGRSCWRQWPSGIGRRYGVALDPETQITSVLGSQEGLSHIGLSILNEGRRGAAAGALLPVFADGRSTGRRPSYTICPC